MSEKHHNVPTILQLSVALLFAFGSCLTMTKYDKWIDHSHDSLCGGAILTAVYSAVYRVRKPGFLTKFAYYPIPD